MTTGLAFSLESAINQRFEKGFDSKDAIILAITLPKFKLKWVELQNTKDGYTQMLIDEIRFYAEPNHSTEAEEKPDFFEFGSDEESHVTQWRWRQPGI